jgi:hypothetical protein
MTFRTAQSANDVPRSERLLLSRFHELVGEWKRDILGPGERNCWEVGRVVVL